MFLQRIYAILIILGMSHFLIGCAPFTSIHGNLPEADTISKIHVGEQNQAQVIELLGPPTSIAPFDPKKWYYMGEKTERLAFLNPDVTEKIIFAIDFDDAGLVSAITPIEEPHNFEIAPHTRKTKTLGRDPSLLQQIFGNFGKFSRQKSDSAKSP